MLTSGTPRASKYQSVVFPVLLQDCIRKFKMQRFDGKVCVVTGSTAGIGLAIAERFVAEGGKVCVSSRKQDAVDAAVAKLAKLSSKQSNVTGVVCHVAKAEDRLKLLRHATSTLGGTIDVLVLNAAASSHFGPTMDTPEKAYDQMFNTNVKMTFLMAKEARPFLTPSKCNAGDFSTNILLVASVAGYIPTAPIGIYGVTKTAMIGLTKAMAVDFAEKKVRVNCLCPGVIRTKFSELLVDAVESGHDSKSGGPLDGGLLRRVGEASEMAAVAAFICSADGSYVTAETIVASGGSARL